KDAVAKEINLQREVTKEFGRNAAQAVAAVADKLGNTQSYERYQEARTLLEAELQNTDSKAEKAAIRASLGQVNAYLAENQSRYDTWKEGGIGRSILHGAAGGLTTGSLGGILAGSGTSLAAPYLDKAAENLGPAGKAAVNALGGAAIGYAAGGNVGTAAVGANVDWNNRQLHPKETQILNKLSKGKSAEEQYRLKAAACALTRCAEGVPDFDPLYKGLKNLQDAGKQFVAEQNVLMRTDAFKYGTWNSLNDIRSSYDRAATKIKGAGNMGLGATTFVGSGAIGGGLCSTGIGCAAGGLIATAGMTGGYTQASEGSRQLFGTYQSDFGKKVVLSLGTPIEYESPLVSDAKNLAVWGLETLITRKLGNLATGVKTSLTPKTADVQRNILSQSEVGIKWGKGIEGQGMPWEDYVGKGLSANARLPKNFKTFDYFDRGTGTAISAKTLDTQTTARLSKPEQLYSTMKGYIDKTANFKSYELSEVPLRADMIKQREIHLAIPAQTNKEQRLQLQRVVEYGKSQNITVKITEIE
ncbi:TPA: hemagglutinin, partial [Neisseria meningitidis]